MKIIEAMKKIKELQDKAGDLRAKVALYCADLDHETPTYGTPEDQTKQIESWMQMHSDVIAEIMRLRMAIQRTNLQTVVQIEINGKRIEKTIAEWIHRRRDLAKLEQEMWSKLTDKNLREGFMATTSGGQVQVRLRRYYSPAKRDEMVALFKSEPMTVDATMEVINAVTDVIE